MKKIIILSLIILFCLKTQKVFAIQAGREVRVMVNPENVDDVSASSLARNIVNRIEETLTYPGQIKVIVIRESRSEEIAS